MRLLFFALIFLDITGCTTVRNKDGQLQFETYGARERRLTEEKFESMYIREKGVVYNKVATPQKYNEFAKQFCSKLSEKNCDEKFHKMYFANIKKTYVYANPKWVNNECAADPAICQGFLNYEAMIATSHNNGVDALKEQYLANERASNASDYSGIANQWGESQKQLWNNVTPKQCTSNPDGLGGYNTRCN